MCVVMCSHGCCPWVHTPLQWPQAWVRGALCRPLMLRTSLFRFMDCMESHGACTMVPCTRCQPHLNMQPPRLLPNPRLLSTSRRPSGTCTSPTSACQVGRMALVWPTGCPPASPAVVLQVPKASIAPKSHTVAGVCTGEGFKPQQHGLCCGCVLGTQ